MSRSAGGRLESCKLDDSNNETGERMKRRKLGSQGLETSCMGLGCMGMSDVYGPADRSESVEQAGYGAVGQLISVRTERR